MTYNRSSNGFTLIELMLAMTFFGVLLMLATALFVQTLGMYTRGLTVKQINQASRTLTDDIARVSNSTSANFELSGQSTEASLQDTLVSRCMRLGQTVYIWSYSYDHDGVFNDTYKAKKMYRYNDTKRPISFARLQQGTCPTPTTYYQAGIDRKSVIPLVGDNVRVNEFAIYNNATYGLVKLKIVLGTYAGLNSPNNLQSTPEKYDTLNNRWRLGSFECSPGLLNNFCAFSIFETIIYLPNNAVVE